MIGHLTRRIAALTAEPPRWLFIFLWTIWLPFLVPSILHLFDGRYQRWQIAVALVDVAVFVGAYLWAAEHNSITRDSSAEASLDPPLVDAWPLGLMAALTVITVSVFGGVWAGMAIYTGASIAPHFRTRRAVWLVILWTALMTILALARDTDLALVGQFGLLTGGIGMSVVLLAQTARTVRQLRAAQAEVARLAVADERLHFARDLHDLLGHSLSLIALKCDLARQLLPDAPERARQEMADAEQVTRAALREVREAVAGYRHTGLAAEIAGAREVLTAAGIDLDYTADPVALPPEIESVLAWSVREGVTNVVRHSGARRCTIRLLEERAAISLTLVDDGHVGLMSAAPPAHGGNGLAGLAERARALGGSCQAGPTDAGGFRLNVRMPVKPGWPAPAQTRALGVAE